MTGRMRRTIFLLSFTLNISLPHAPTGASVGGCKRSANFARLLSSRRRRKVFTLNSRRRIPTPTGAENSSLFAKLISRYGSICVSL